MARWRRLCIDVDDDLQVIGASVEYYGDRKVDPEQIGVLARGDWSGHSPASLLDVLLAEGWTQPSLVFGPPSWETPSG